MYWICESLPKDDSPLYRWKYHVDYDNNTPIGKLTDFWQFQEFTLTESIRDQFHFKRTVFSSHLKSKEDIILDKDPSHSQTSRLLTSSLS